MESAASTSVHNGHLEVVKTLLEVGGRELAMLTADVGSAAST